MRICMIQANVAKVFFQLTTIKSVVIFYTDKQVSVKLAQIIDRRPLWGWRPRLENPGSATAAES